MAELSLIAAKGHNGTAELLKTIGNVCSTVAIIDYSL